VGNEYLADSWQSSKPKSARTPDTQRKKNADASVDSIDKSLSDNARSSRSVAAVLEQPEFDPPRPAARTKPDALSTRSRSANSGGTVRNGNVIEYEIQEGDTLSDIARRFLGSAALYDQLFQENMDVLSDPGIVPVGKKIRIPAGPKVDRAGTDRVVARTAALTSGSPVVPPRTARTSPHGDAGAPSDRSATYVVKEGDSLIGIARHYYGKDSMYLQIMRANDDQIVNPSDIQPGMVLRLP
jgi:nucleoid-associated protein YgaU